MTLSEIKKAIRDVRDALIKADPCMEKCMHEVKQKHPDWSQDQRVAVCLKKCGESNQ